MSTFLFSNFTGVTVLLDDLRYGSAGSHCRTSSNTLCSTGNKVSTETVYQYIEYLEAANILIRTDVYNIRGKRVLSSKHRYHVSDLGIKHALLGYRPEDTPGHMENIICTELLGRGFDVYVGDFNRKEIDPIAEKNGNRMYIQACQTVSSDETWKREFGNLESIGDSFPKYVITLEPENHEGTTSSGIVCCGLKDFPLMDF